MEKKILSSDEIKKKSEEFLVSYPKYDINHIKELAKNLGVSEEYIQQIITNIKMPKSSFPEFGKKIPEPLYFNPENLEFKEIDDEYTEDEINKEREKLSKLPLAKRIQQPLQKYEFVRKTKEGKKIYKLREKSDELDFRTMPKSATVAAGLGATIISMFVVFTVVAIMVVVFAILYIPGVIIAFFMAMAMENKRSDTNKARPYWLMWRSWIYVFSSKNVALHYS